MRKLEHVGEQRDGRFGARVDGPRAGFVEPGKGELPIPGGGVGDFAAPGFGDLRGGGQGGGAGFAGRFEPLQDHCRHGVLAGRAGMHGVALEIDERRWQRGRRGGGRRGGGRRLRGRFLGGCLGTFAPVFTPEREERMELIDKDGLLLGGEFLERVGEGVELFAVRRFPVPHDAAVMHGERRMPQDEGRGKSECLRPIPDFRRGNRDYSLSSRTTACSSASPRRPVSRSMPFLSMSQVAGIESMP